MITTDDEDTQPTDGMTLLEQLRADGVFDRFYVTAWAGDSVVGQVRAHNEDRWVQLDGTVFVVADGMGGHEGGALAAQVTIDELSARRSELVGGVIERAIGAASEQVIIQGGARGITGLGSTVSVLAIRGRHALLANVGDSRIYRWRDGSLEQLTRDHTVRNELLDSGISPGEVSSSVRLDALTAYVGRADTDDCGVSASSFALHPDDRYLLCSDGVHGQLGEDFMASVLDGYRSCAQVVGSLLDAADEAGGRDNATAIVVDIGVRGAT